MLYFLSTFRNRNYPGGTKCLEKMYQTTGYDPGLGRIPYFESISIPGIRDMTSGGLLNKI